MEKISSIFVAFLENTNFTKIMPIFRSLDLERMLIYQKFFYAKVLFTTQLIDAEVAKKISNVI